MEAFRGSGPAAKKPRIDNAIDESIWDQAEEFTADDLAQVDIISSQYSQTSKDPTSVLSNDGTLLQKQYCWTSSPNENLFPSNSHNISKSRTLLVPLNRTDSGCNGNHVLGSFKNRPLANSSSKKPEVKSWNSASPFEGQKLSGASLQEAERQKQEIQRLQVEKIKFEAQIKQMNDALSRKDFEIQAARSEVDSLKQQSLFKETRQQEHVQEIERLNTELKFKCQELASEQWRVHQQTYVRTNNDNSNNKKLFISPSIGSPPKQKIFKSPLKVTVNNSFPSQAVFSKRLSLNTFDDPSNIPGKSTTTMGDTAFHQNQSDSILQLKHPLGIETGPGLVGILLQETETLHPVSGVLMTNITEKNEVPGGCDWLTPPTKVPRSKCYSPPNCLQRVQDVPSTLSVIPGISGLLGDDGTTKANEDARERLVPPEFSIFKICLGLRLDTANSILPYIDNVLSSSFAACSIKSVMQEPAIPSAGATHSPHSPPNRHCSQSGRTFLAATQNAICSLKVLKHLVYHSPAVCQCLINNTSENFYAKSKNSMGNDSVQPGTPFAPSVQLMDCEPKHCFHPVVQNMFEFCSQPLQLQCKIDASLLLLTLEILGAVVRNCPFDELPRFLPLISPQMLQNCSNLALGGSIFVKLVSLLGTLCTNPIIVEASCNQDDSCFWILVSTTWQAARKELSNKVMSKLDNLMIQMISTCLTHEGVKAPFLSTDETHCQFEVVSGLILFLHNQSLLYEENLDYVNVSTLRNGVSLLHQVVTRDTDFCHHRTQVNFEMFAFLHWLSRAKTRLKIDSAADVLLEMWNIKDYESCEVKEDFP